MTAAQAPDIEAVLREHPTTLTIELLAKMWRDHANCNWVSNGSDVVWSCGIIHGFGDWPIHMQPTTRDRHLAALLLTQIEAERGLVAAAVLAAGFVRPEDVAEAQAKAWDFGYVSGLGDYGKNDDETQAMNPFRAAALRPVDAPEGGASRG